MAFTYVREVVQDNQNYQASPLTTTFSAPTNGNLLILAFAADKTVGTVTCTTSGWILIDSIQNNGGGNANAYLYYKVSDGTETSVTFTYTDANVAANVHIHEYSGTSPTLDTQGNAGSGASNVYTLAVSSDASVANAGSLCVGFWTHDSGTVTDTSSLDQSGVERSFYHIDGGTPDCLIADILSRTTGALTWTGGTNSRSDQMAGVVGVFYEDVATGPAITDVDTDEIVSQGQTSVAITGTDFTTDTGSADIVLCKVDNVTGTNATSQTETGTRTSTAAYFTANFPSDVAENETCYVFVVDSAGTSNASGFLITREDTTAPTLTSPTGTQTGETTATGTVSTNEATGTLYGIVSTSATPPSVAQIQAGNDSTGSAAAWSGNQAVSATGVQTLYATGLTASTNYYFYFQHADSSSNDSTVSSSAQFTTAAISTSTITTSAITGGESLTGLEWAVFSGQDLSTATLLDQGLGETTDASGVLVLDITGSGANNGDAVWYVIKNVADTIAAQGPATVVVT